MAKFVSPAWEVRRFQRKEFLNRVMHEAERASKKWRGNNFFVVLLADAACYMYGGENVWTRSEIREILMDVVIIPLKSFAGSIEEEPTLLAQLLERHILPNIESGYYSALHRQEVENPKLIFQTEHSGDEMTVP